MNFRDLEHKKQDKIHLMNVIPSKTSMVEGEIVEVFYKGKLRIYRKRNGQLFYLEYTRS